MAQSLSLVVVMLCPCLGMVRMLSGDGLVPGLTTGDGALLVGFNAKLNCVAHWLSWVVDGLVACSALMEAMMMYVIFLF